ncbi:MAG: oligosaccharide flippase family protein [Croceibacterium sp.]
MNRILLRNSGFSILQVVLTTVSVVLVYRLLLENLTIAEIGLWALTVGSASLTRLAEVGLGAGVLRFVAGDLAHGRPERAAMTVATACVTAGALVALLAFAARPFLLHYLQGVAHPSMNEAAVVLLDGVLVGLVLMTIANVFFGAIDASQRMDIRAVIQVGGSLVQLGATWLLLPLHGLGGMGLVQVAQASFLCVASAIVAIVLLGMPLRAYLGFDGARFRELIRYGGGLQLSGIAQLAFEPLTKILLTAFGGLSLTGLFDIANRAIIQLRSILIAGTNAIVPLVAAQSVYTEIEDQRLRKIYLKLTSAYRFVVIPYFCLILASLPLLFAVWTSSFSSRLVMIGLVVGLAWMVNCLTAPAYTINVGTGRLRANILAHVFIGLISLAAGMVLGWLFAGPGVVASYALALMLGSLYVPYEFHRRTGISWREIWSGRVLAEVAVVAAALLGPLVIFLRIPDPPTIVLVLPMAVTAALVTLIAWFNPLRPTIIAAARSYFRHGDSP